MMQETPKADPDEYIAAILKLYLELPETPSRAGPDDRRRAIELQRRGIAVSIVESALLLASMRRLGRPPDYPRLPPIRSLAYFLPVVDEILDNPLPEGYFDYMRLKVRLLGGEKHAKQCG